MKYKNIKKGAFIERPNRFIARVLIDGAEHTVHVKNTGRCRELLIHGCTVYLEKSESSGRKTEYDLVAVEKVCDNGEILLINMDSQIPNTVAARWIENCGIFSANAVIRREVTCGDSRFDLCAEVDGKKCYIEVKGVTLERGGVAMFPDAPTERGTKHLRGLARAVKEGHDAMVIFIIQMKGVHKFCPNYTMDPSFTAALRDAASAGVRIIALDCTVTPDSIAVDKEIPVEI